MSKGRVLTSTLKCLAVLETVAAASGPIGVSEIARLQNSSRGTVHQQLATLVEAGWVEQVEGGKYRLTLRAAHVGHRALEQASLGQRIRPALEALAASTGEAVSVGVLDGNGALIVQRVESGQVLRAGLGVGSYMPLATSATGRVLVAFSPPSVPETLRGQGTFLPSDAELEQVRVTGVAVSVDEFMEGIAAVSAPLFDVDGTLIAALSSATPTSRFDAESATDAVRNAAADVNAILAGGSASASTSWQPGMRDREIRRLLSV